MSKGLARAHPDGVDHTPTAFFQDNPVWVADRATAGYVKTCQATKAGEPINPAYWGTRACARRVEFKVTDC